MGGTGQAFGMALLWLAIERSDPKSSEWAKLRPRDMADLSSAA